MPNEEEYTGAKIIQVGEVWLPKIYEYDFVLEDIDYEDSNRDESGRMHRSIKREKMFHASVGHKCQTTDMITICEAIKDDATITVTCLAPSKNSETNPYATFTAYVSKYEAKMIWYENPEGDYECWWQISYQLVEV